MVSMVSTVSTVSTDSIRHLPIPQTSTTAHLRAIASLAAVLPSLFAHVVVAVVVVPVVVAIVVASTTAADSRLRLVLVPSLTSLGSSTRMGTSTAAAAAAAAIAVATVLVGSAPVGCEQLTVSTLKGSETTDGSVSDECVLCLRFVCKRLTSIRTEMISDFCFCTFLSSNFFRFFFFTVLCFFYFPFPVLLFTLFFTFCVAFHAFLFLFSLTLFSTTGLK